MKAIVRYLVVALLEVSAFSAYLINWMLPFFARTGADGYQHLPSWLKWFDTFDAPTDAGWRDGYFVAKGTYTLENPPPFWKRKWYQIRWLYRNSTYGFSYYALGMPLVREDWTVKYWKFDTGEMFLAWTSDWHFNFLYEGRFGSYKFGWKVWNYWDTDTSTWKVNADGTPYQWGPEMRVPSTFSPNPFKALSWKS